MRVTFFSVMAAGAIAVLIENSEQPTELTQYNESTYDLALIQDDIADYEDDFAERSDYDSDYDLEEVSEESDVGKKIWKVAKKAPKRAKKAAKKPKR